MASITGTLFNDHNQTGKYDRGDGAAKRARVFIGTDNDGVPDATEISVLTDGSGRQYS